MSATDRDLLPTPSEPPRDPRDPRADAARDGRGRREWRLFLTALMYFSRVPVPAWVGFSTAQLNACTRWFPAVGLLVGAVSAAVWALASWLTTPLIGVVMAMIAGVLLTGAFHEDGLADSCDGLGGGWSREQVLAIMKDSRVGSYATVGLGLALLLRFFLLAALTGRAWPAAQDAGFGWEGPNASLPLIVPALLAGHALSRWTAASVMASLPYVRLDDTAKVKPVADALRPAHLAFAALTVLPALWLLGEGALWGLGGVLAALLARAGLVRWFRRRLGGYTGDLLGATQQVCECAFLFGLLATARWQSLL
jgi:adenosylcobinamide-GDP ribazoletransferase